MNGDKKLLVITPTFNRAELITNAIKSIQSQDHTNWNLIIVDDCSTDNTTEVVKPFLKQDNIHYIKNQENLGCYKSRNRALKYSLDNDIQWDFFLTFDSDDFSASNYFSFNLQLFDDPKIISVSPCISRVPHVDFNFNFSVNKGYYAQWPCGIYFYKRKVFDLIGYFDDTRFSGDSEYNHRLEKYMQLSGLSFIRKKAPPHGRFYFALDHPNRLGRAEATHLQSSARNHYRSKYNTKIHLTKNKDELKYLYC